MKSLSKTMVIAGGLALSGMIVATLAVAGNVDGNELWMLGAQRVRRSRKVFVRVLDAVARRDAQLHHHAVGLGAVHARRDVGLELSDSLDWSSAHK